MNKMEIKGDSKEYKLTNTKAFYGNILILVDKDDNNYYCKSDIFRCLMAHYNYKQCWQMHTAIYLTDEKDPPMTFANENDVKQLLFKNKKPKYQILAKDLSFDVKDIAVKCDILKKIDMAVPDLKLGPRCRLGEFIVDAYSEKYNMIIESLDRKKEKMRNERINLERKPSWIYFDPKNFDLETLMK